MSLTVEQDAEVADNVSRLNDGRTDFESTEKQTDRQTDTNKTPLNVLPRCIRRLY